MNPLNLLLVRTSEGIVVDLQFFAARDSVREQVPLVQCLTNSVVMEITANVLLAAGASPAMCDTPEESRGFAQVASGVLINPGTPSAAQYKGMREAVDGANDAATPWVLDPVAAGGLEHRTEFMRSLLPARPAAIRGNASEIIALATGGTGGRGVDATADVLDALEPARQLVMDTGGIVAVSGAQDLIVGQKRAVLLTSGHPMLQRVIGTGCSLGALCAAYLGVWRDPFEAVLAAHAHVGAAGILAAERAQAPGSFAVAWLDCLYELDSDAIARLVFVDEVMD